MSSNREVLVGVEAAQSRIVVDSFRPDAKTHAYTCATDPLRHRSVNVFDVIGERHFGGFRLHRRENPNEFDLVFGRVDTMSRPDATEIPWPVVAAVMRNTARWVAEAVLADDGFAAYETATFSGFFNQHSYEHTSAWHIHREDLSLVRSEPRKEKTFLLKEPVLGAMQRLIDEDGGVGEDSIYLNGTEDAMLERLLGIDIGDYVVNPFGADETVGLRPGSFHRAPLHTERISPPRELITAFVEYS